MTDTNDNSWRQYNGAIVKPLDQWLPIADDYVASTKGGVILGYTLSTINGLLALIDYVEETAVNDKLIEARLDGAYTYYGFKHTYLNYVKTLAETIEDKWNTATIDELIELIDKEFSKFDIELIKALRPLLEVKVFPAEASIFLLDGIIYRSPLLEATADKKEILESLSEQIFKHVIDAANEITKDIASDNEPTDEESEVLPSTDKNTVSDVRAGDGNLPAIFTDILDVQDNKYLMRAAVLKPLLIDKYPAHYKDYFNIAQKSLIDCAESLTEQVEREKQRLATINTEDKK